MDETLLFPSPNWFLVSNLAVSRDGWIIYGGPSKSICVLEPLIPGAGVISGNHTYHAHVATRAHPERVVSVAISPEFLEKRNFLSGGSDGTAKQWVMEKVNNKYIIKTTHSHEVHYNDKEEIVGVGYSSARIAITVGSFGNVVSWDLNSNVCKTHPKFLASFRPTCMSCSPHVPLHVAVGTKQGVVFVLNLEGNGKIVYKIRSQDDEITNISWCPQYELLVNKILKTVEKKSTATSRMEAIRNEPEPEPEKVDILEQSGIIKNLPEDSFDEPVVEEDDMFNIYKDHEADEFGHKKYEPEDILVKVKDEKSEENDYLAECLKLKEDILKRKNQEEQSIESLVEAMDKTHVDNRETESIEPQAGTSNVKCEREKSTEASVHVHKHLLAAIGRHGSIRILSKAGRLVASCTVLCNNKLPRNKVSSWPNVLWYKPDLLLFIDGKSQLLECNPLRIDSKNKLEWRVVHALHKRGLFGVVSDAPRVQTSYDVPESPDYFDSSKWSVYTVSQDRNIIRYSMKNRKALATYNTCGGFLYNVQSCPYDAGKLAISVGDGAVRVWQTTTLANDDTKLYPPRVQSYWQNVQGKVLTVAWHPTKENLLAFGTGESRGSVILANVQGKVLTVAWHPTKENLLAFGTGESRVGVLDTSGKNEKPARVLCPALNGGVYSLCWGDGMDLYASGGRNLVLYNAMKDDAPKYIEVEVDGQKWDIGSVTWSPRGLLCGSNLGAVAVLDPTTQELQACAFPFTKLIHSMEWHPVQTSHSSEESPYKNLIAVSSLDKNCNIVILEYQDKEGGGKQLTTWKTLTGHRIAVLQLAWNPHRDELLLSTSQDTTVMVWDISSGACVSIFGGHMQHSLGATWCAMPQFESKIMSGGGDHCLRLWDYNDHKAENYQKIRHETSTKAKKVEKKKQIDEPPKQEPDQQVAANHEVGRKPSKRYILPIIHRQMNPCPAAAVKQMVQKFVENDSSDHEKNDKREKVDYDVDFIKIFGSINEVNEVLEMELANLLDEDIPEAWITLSIFRGHIDSMIQFASQREMLCPYLLTQAPCVSFKYWKEVTQLYIAQLDRMIARGAEHKLCENRQFGGAVYKKAATLLSVHDVRGAVSALTDAKLFKEAYILCRIRYMDSIAQQTLEHWAKDNYFSGNMRLAAICYIALGNLSEAATVLAKYCDQETLAIAADLAKIVGRKTFADHVENKAQTAVCRTEKERLADLPSRIELLLKGDQDGEEKTQVEVEQGETADKIEDKLNGDINENKVDV